MLLQFAQAVLVGVGVVRHSVRELGTDGSVRSTSGDIPGNDLGT